MSRLIIGKDEDQGLVSSEKVLIIPVPIALLVRMQHSVQGCRRAKHNTYSPLDDRRVLFSTSKAFNDV